MDPTGSRGNGTVEEAIAAHFGVKGMHWGKRKSKGPPSADSTVATELQKRVKTSGTKNLSNKELQDLVTRINLEQQYSKLAAQGKKKNPAAKFAAELIVNVGKAQATKVANDIAAKQVAAMLARKHVGK